MNKNDEIWQEYYKKVLSKPHMARTELAVKLNNSNKKIAIDMGCGTGCDSGYIAQLGYHVFSFDINGESISICQERFKNEAQVTISQSSFENYDYPKCGLIIANSSLFFAQPTLFEITWGRIVASIEKGGVFAGDFMGINDSWASGYRSSTSPMTRSEVEALFSSFEIIRFNERDEIGKTAIGKIKHWHTFSVVAVKLT